MSDSGSSKPLVPPLYQSSVYCIADLDILDRISNGEEGGYIYARDAHPNAARLARRLADMENAAWAIVNSSGMASISAIVLALVQQGDRIVASNRLYGRTTQLFLQELIRYGIQTTLVDASDLAAVENALGMGKPRPRLLFVETMSNPLLQLVDVPALAHLAHANESLLAVDNTFATPCLFRPLDVGADLVMESLTKMIGGHSDVTLGAVAGGCKGKQDGPIAREQLAQVGSIWGLSSPPFDCWLAERSLDTLSLRMDAACRNAARLARWLADQRGVKQVIYPGLADHPDRDLAERLLAKDAAGQTLFGNMLCFDLAGGRDAVNRFMRQTPEGIPFSPSLGNTTTTCSHPASTSHRYVSPAERNRQGIGDGLIRLSVGIEDLNNIQKEIARGLA